ncbi:GAF domain-containing protein [Actinoplanes sp. TBRC 11911]|uniref:GAF domain-containing sensor histidine kinase n=1 Tax=Actinoplanes sp. TBRC 11911 TaxID=2729386 RepID=UPI00145F9252|nr:GAF domain-containing protein [Actinoplanes sp. TBRC 11911]NMO53933.1 GAF domain-containing protein [Actinoplanes sp. TBRC 11911]
MTASLPRGWFVAMAVGAAAATTAVARNAIAAGRARGNLADEQAALRRVATLVARGCTPSDVFAAVAKELGRLFGAETAFVARLTTNPDANAEPYGTIVGSYHRSATPTPPGTTLPLSDTIDAGAPVRVGGEITAPVVVGSRVWGVTVVRSPEAFPPGAESRVADFVLLIAMAISNSEAVERGARLGNVQEALRRIAVLIANGEAPERVFAAITSEVLHHFGDGGSVRLLRFEPDGDTVTLVAHQGTPRPHVETGQPFTMARPRGGIVETVRRTGRAARVEDFRALAGAEAIVREGLISAVGIPVYVTGRLWGLIAIGSAKGPLPVDLESRMTQFTGLVATAVADAQSRAELIDSRARIVAASDETRRCIERDLHDGVQQSLVAVALRLQTGGGGDEVAGAAADLMAAIDQLRELSHGIHPAVLSRSGLTPALRALGRRSPLPMKMDLRIDGRLPTPVEVGAYYVVSEVLTNAAKHAHASAVGVEAETMDGVLTVRVRDDGVGGADPALGSGLLGLKDRIEALGGTFEVLSPLGEGTTVVCHVPI